MCLPMPPSWFSEKNFLITQNSTAQRLILMHFGAFLPLLHTHTHIFKILFTFRERAKEGEREGEKH